MTGEDQSSRDQVAEILLALFGEKCSYLKSDVMGLVFSFQSEELVSVLPRALAPRMVMIARMATNVHAIDKWRHGLGVLGPIRRAFVDAVLQAYDSYLGLIDYARNNCHTDGTEFTVKDVLGLVTEWYGRLNFLHNLVDAVGSKSGTDILSLLYDEWSLHCVADWSHSLLENALNGCSAAFHKVACAWLLDGKLTGKTEWMIVDLKRAGSSTTDVPFELRSAPSPLADSPDLIRKIYEVGRTVHFLKGLRSQKTYEHRLEERTRLLDEGMDKQRLWYCAKARAKLYMVLDLLARHVSADAFNELVVRQRLLDHIGYIHQFFYMLHGDFITNLESSIRESSKRGRSKSGQGYVTPKHSSPSFVAEACVNYALKGSIHPAQFEDLRKYMTADRSKGSSKVNLADLFKLDYKPPRPIVTVLNESCIKRYRAVFTFICPHRFLQLSVSEVWWKLKRVAGAKLLKSRSKGLSHFVRLLYSHLDVLTNYSRVVVKYIFEDVLSVASAELLEAMRKVQDLDALVFRHEGHITDVIVALFLHRSTKDIYDRLFGCLNSARSLLSLLDQSVVKLEAEVAQSSKLEAELATLQANKDKENVDVRRVTSIEERLGAFNSLGPNTVAAYRKPLEQSANGLKDCLYALRASYEQLVTDAAIKQSPCWERFGDVLKFLGNQ